MTMATGNIPQTPSAWCDWAERNTPDSPAAMLALVQAAIELYAVDLAPPGDATAVFLTALERGLVSMVGSGALNPLI
jgi:hypothetical protein